jgi:hypothetical protein
MAEDTPSKIILSQRVRNRIIEYLQVASSFQDQLEYQIAVPYVSVPGEMIEQWADWIAHDDPLKDCDDPVFSAEERQAILQFHKAWNKVCDRTPRQLPSLVVLFSDPMWEELRKAAAEALSVFIKRGKFPEDDEVF